MIPELNATLNSISAVLLVVGFIMIRKGNRRAHKAAMIGAFLVSTVFLISYLIYHAQVGSVRFTGTGWIRPVYFAILISHIILATLIVPLALTSIILAWREKFTRHRKIARWALPIWLYVSVTGVAVYWMLYRMG